MATQRRVESVYLEEIDLTPHGVFFVHEVNNWYGVKPMIPVSFHTIPHWFYTDAVAPCGCQFNITCDDNTEFECMVTQWDKFMVDDMVVDNTFEAFDTLANFQFRIYVIPDTVKVMLMGMAVLNINDNHTAIRIIHSDEEEESDDMPELEEVDDTQEINASVASMNLE